MPSIGGGETAACFACTPHGSDNSGRAYRDKRIRGCGVDGRDQRIEKRAERDSDKRTLRSDPLGTVAEVTPTPVKPGASAESRSAYARDRT